MVDDCVTKDFVTDLTEKLREQGFQFALVAVDPHSDPDTGIMFEGNIQPDFGHLIKYLMAEFVEQLEEDFPESKEKPPKKPKKE